VPPAVNRSMPIDAPTITARTGAECHEIDGKYFTIGSRLQPLVRKLQHGCTEEEVKDEVDLLCRNRLGERQRLTGFIDEMFAPFGLVVERSPGGAESIWRLRAAASSALARSSPQSALRCRVTILPEAVAGRAADMAKCLYTYAGVALATVFWFTAFLLYLRRFGAKGFSLDLLFESLHQISGVNVVIVAFSALAASLFHEVGHCAAVAAFGARVRRVGFGIYWLSPAFFSDVSSAWTLGRWQRVVVDCGGIYFQLLTCGAYALLAVAINSPGVQTALQISIMVNLLSVLCSLDPMMKYDGYWIISDALNIPNLRRRSEGVLRECLRFGFFANANPSLPTHAGQRGRSGHRIFLIGYAVISVLFTLLFLVVLALSIRNHLAEAAQFPARVWVVAKQDFALRRFGPEATKLAVASLRLIPVVCAPIALVTAVSSVLGFIRRISVKE
jgi:hypothetical protein